MLLKIVTLHGVAVSAIEARGAAAAATAASKSRGNVAWRFTNAAGLQQLQATKLQPRFKATVSEAQHTRSVMHGDDH